MEGVTDADVRGVTGEILAIVIARLDSYDDDAGPAGRRLSSWQVDDRGHAVLVRRATRESLRSPRRFAIVFCSEMEAALGMAHYRGTLRLTRGGRERWERRLDELWAWVRCAWPVGAESVVTARDLGQTCFSTKSESLAGSWGWSAPRRRITGRRTRRSGRGLLH